MFGRAVGAAAASVQRRLALSIAIIVIVNPHMLTHNTAYTPTHNDNATTNKNNSIAWTSVQLLFNNFFITFKEVSLQWLTQLKWLSAVYYAYEGMAVIEFSGVKVACGGGLDPKGFAFLRELLPNTRLLGLKAVQRGLSEPGPDCVADAGAVDELVDRLAHARPVRCGAPAVVDDDDHGPRAREARGRVHHRLGQREDDEGRDHQAQQQQPPRRARGRLLARSQPQQDRDRGEGDLARGGRRHAQQQPQRRQRRERDEPERRKEGERAESGHWRDPPRPSAARDSSCQRAMSALSGERSVRCDSSGQPSARAMSRRPARCDAKARA